LNRQRHLEGIKLLNTGKFFEAHEVLEDIWREAPAEERKYWQGLVQVAVALHHHSTGNIVGARSVMARAARNLGPCSTEWHGINIGELQRVLAQWLEAVRNGKTTPVPEITFVDC
jgi:uncharacterized protein